ncbi:hypothetical protein EDD85DRAFT_785312 [Armillaria nabsnona]|nr:hypothetical protein EDD85DRAFT_785312 [Armillaria nabsnona]
MKLTPSQLFVILTTALRATVSSKEPNPNGNGFNPFWPNNPFWNGIGNTPLQPQTGNNPNFPAQYGTWPQNPALNTPGPQGMQMGWQNPYAYQPFPPPGFMPGLAAYFGNFAPPAPTNPLANTGPIVDDENSETSRTGENEPMTVDNSNTNQNMAPGIANVNVQPRTLRVNAVAGPSQPCCPTVNRPPPRVAYTQETWERERQNTEVLHRTIEEEPIPREVIELQESELQNVGDRPAGDTAAALWEQITLNIDLMKWYNELEKLLWKRQLSPNGDKNSTPKRMKDSCRTASSDRRQTENDFDTFLMDDNNKWDNRSFEKHNLYLESYDEQQFGHIIRDSRMSLTDRIKELSALLLTMPHPDGTFPPCMLSPRDIAEDKNTSEASDDPYDDKLPYTAEQKQKRFKHRLLLHQCQPGWLPTWLGRFRFPNGSAVKRDNSFRGMYGPGFTYDPRNSIMYADMEAVDAARVLSNQAEYLLPYRMESRPNPQGFPMTVHKRDPRLGNLGDNLPSPACIPLDRVYCLSGGGNIVGGGAGLPVPVNSTIDEWCQYVAHHFWPGGLNPPVGLTMDLSYRWNTDQTEEVPIKQAKETILWRMGLVPPPGRLAPATTTAGKPQIIPELRGWWTPDPDGHNQQQENLSWLLRGESSVFTYINSFPPTTPHTPDQLDSNVELNSYQEDVPMTPMVDTAVDDAVEIRPEAVPNATAQGNMIAMMPVETSANPHDIPLPEETDEEMSEVHVPTAEVEVDAQEKLPEVMPAAKSHQVTYTAKSKF